MTVRVRDVPRSRDDEVLRWVRLRSIGFSTVEIAKRAKASAGYIVSTTNKVRDCDERESGEDISSAYW